MESSYMICYRNLLLLPIVRLLPLSAGKTQLAIYITHMQHATYAGERSSLLFQVEQDIARNQTNAIRLISYPEGIEVAEHAASYTVKNRHNNLMH